MKRWAVFIIMAFFILGGIIGEVMLSPLLHLEPKTAGSIGILLGLLLSWPVPGLWKSLAEVRNEGVRKALDKNQYIGSLGYFTYRTQLPMTLGGLWFLGFLIVMLAFSMIFKSTNVPAQLLPLWFLPTLLLVGLSGFLMLISNESVTRGGFILRGTSAYVDGIGYTLIGWGGCILIILSFIFHWW
jgi:hypothetical protein